MMLLSLFHRIHHLLINKNILFFVYMMIRNHEVNDNTSWYMQILRLGCFVRLVEIYLQIIQDDSFQNIALRISLEHVKSSDYDGLII